MLVKSQDYMSIEKKLYIPELVSELKPDSSWQINEMKIFSLILNRLKPYIHLLKKDSNIDELKTQLGNIDNTFTFTVKELSKQLDISPKNFSKVAKRLKKTLKLKSIETQHPDIPDDDDSFDSYIMINRVTYNGKDGLFSVRVDKLAIERLIYFSKYGRSDIKYIDKFHNKYALYLYMIMKITLDSSKRQKKSFKLSIEEFKLLLNLEDKYRNYSEFKKYVLEVINAEINSVDSDLKLTITPEKVGKAYKKVSLFFDYRSEFIESEKISKTDFKKNKTKKITTAKEEPYFDVIDAPNDAIYAALPFEQTLVGWGIRAKKVVEFYEMYSLDIISQSIDETIQADSDGKIKGTKAQYIIGVLENKQKSDDEMFERQLNESRKKEDEAIKASELAKKEKQYNELQNDIHLYEDDLSKYLSAKSVGGNVDISKEAVHFIEMTSNVNKEIFKGYKPKFAVLENGYMDLQAGKTIRPNMYDFLCLVK